MSLIADMRLVFAFCGLFALLLALSVLSPTTIADHTGSAGPMDSQDVEVSAILDANEIGMYVSNNGSLAKDESFANDRYEGFYYPLDSGLILMASAGLWLSAEANHTIRVAMAEYISEFAPGPYDHEPVDDSSVFHVYKISSSDIISPSDDWVNWPAEWGAPTDAHGEPLLTGEQSVWAVFNDSDTARHRLRGGDTSPLEAEVQLYAYAYKDAGLLDNVIFLDYKIINKSQHEWKNLLAGLWSDPDIGFYADDKCGTDSALSLVYCYTLEGDTDLPVSFMPVVGVMMLDSPSSAITGNPSGSANVLKNIYRSRSVEMTLNILTGMTADGGEYIDPTTGTATRYPFGGDPRSGEGWLDDGKGDRKTMITSAPVTVAAGDSVSLRAAFIAASGETNFEALKNFHEVVGAVADFQAFGLNGLQADQNVRDGTIQTVSFTPQEQTWFTGSDWGGSAFSGGIGLAGRLWGTSLQRADNVDVEFLFAPGGGQDAARFVEQGGLYRFAGISAVPFFCRRLADSTLVNVLIVDANKDGKWAVTAEGNAQPDLVLVTQSEYDEIPLAYYEDKIFPNAALETDLMYAIALSLKPGHERKNIRAGQRLQIRVDTEGEAASADTLDFGDAVVGFDKSISIVLRDVYMYDKRYALYLDKPDQFMVSKPQMAIAGDDTVRARITFHPSDTLACETILTIIATDYNLPVKRILLKGRGAIWPLAGDLRPDGSLDLLDVVAFIRYLYSSYILPEEIVVLDLDESGEVTLADLVLLVDTIFSHD